MSRNTYQTVAERIEHHRNPYCSVCGQLIPKHMDSVIRHNDVVVCWHHLMSVINKPEKPHLLKPLGSMPKDFNFSVFLKDCMRILSLKPLKSKKAQNTFLLLDEFLKKSKLSSYFGTAELFSPDFK